MSARWVTCTCRYCRATRERYGWWAAGSAVAMLERIHSGKPWSSRRVVLRALRALLKGR